MNALARIFDKLWAVMRRDLLTAMRYRHSVLFQVVGVASELAAFYFLARAVGPGFRPDGIDFFSFLVVGTAYFGMLMTGSNAMLAAVQHAQLTGTFEVLMTTATPAPVVILLSGLSQFGGKLLSTAAYVAVGLVIGGVSTSPNWLAVIIVVLLSLAIAISVGITAAALQVWIQKGSAVNWLLGSAGWLLSGTLYPISALPAPLRELARMLPLTRATDALRKVLVRGASVGEIAGDLTILFAGVVIALAVSFVLFNAAIRTAQREGTLAYY